MLETTFSVWFFIVGNISTLAAHSNPVPCVCFKRLKIVIKLLYFVSSILFMASVNTEEEKTPPTGSDQQKYVDKTGLVSEDGKNLKWLLCPHCDSKILQPNKGEYLEKEVSMSRKRCNSRNSPDVLYYYTPCGQYGGFESCKTTYYSLRSTHSINLVCHAFRLCETW
jgi:hypothetical protein